MRLKLIFISMFFSIPLLITACQSFDATRGYTSPEVVKNNSEVVVDKYQGGKNINGPKQYFDINQNSGTFFMMRHVISNNDLQTTQVYFEILRDEWAFYNKAYFENGEKADFLKIDGKTGTGYSGAYVIEIFGVNVPDKLFSEKIESGDDLKIMVYGKRDKREIVIQSAYLKGFYEFMNENK